MSFLASGFLGAILSPLRIYGYTFEKNCLKIIFPALLMLDTVSVPYEALVFRIYGYLFSEVLPDLYVLYLRPKWHTPRIKRFELPLPPELLLQFGRKYLSFRSLAVVGCLFGATYENPALGFSRIIFIGDDRKT